MSHLLDDDFDAPAARTDPAAEPPLDITSAKKGLKTAKTDLKPDSADLNLAKDNLNLAKDDLNLANQGFPPPSDPEIDDSEVSTNFTRDAIFRAFKEVGGWRYLWVLANSAVASDRTAFINLVRQTIPAKVEGHVSLGITVSTVNYAVERAAQELIQRAAKHEEDPSTPSNCEDVDFKDSPLLD